MTIQCGRDRGHSVKLPMLRGPGWDPSRVWVSSELPKEKRVPPTAVGAMGRLQTCLES